MSSVPTAVALHCPHGAARPSPSLFGARAHRHQPAIYLGTRVSIPSEHPGSFPNSSFGDRISNLDAPKTHTLATVGHGIVAWNSRPFPAEAAAECKRTMQVLTAQAQAKPLPSHSAEWPASHCHNDPQSRDRFDSGPLQPCHDRGRVAWVHDLSMLQCLCHGSRRQQ